YTSTCESNIRPKQTYHYSPQYQQSIKKKLSSSIPLSFNILDKLISIDKNEPISNIQMLPQEAHTLQILQNSHIHSFMSIDYLNHNQISGMGDQVNLNKTDVATQWSLQILTPKCNESKSDSSVKHQDDQENSSTNSTILTELNQSITTLTTNNSAI